MIGKKEDGKMSSSPLFPRLNVNDTERGGPRAPPRNKMALYEQLSIPSQKFSPGSASMLPFPTPSGSSLGSSMPSSNGGQERSVYSQFCNSPAHSSLVEKLHSYSSSGIKPNILAENQERQSVKSSNCQSSNAAGHLSSAVKRSSFKPCNFSNFRHFSLRKPRDEDDLRVSSPKLGVAPHCSDSQQSNYRKFSQKRGSGLGITSGPCMRTQNDDYTSRTSQDPVNNYSSFLLSRDRNLVDASGVHSSKVRCPKHLKRPNSPLNPEYRSSSTGSQNGLHSSNSRLNQECVALRDAVAHTDSPRMKPARDKDKENSFKVRAESCLRSSLGDESITSEGLEIVKCHEEKNGRSSQVRDVDRQDDVFHTFVMDPVSTLRVSADDVVAVVGEKQFLKARRAIINQQRVFALQVFELHRLLKVQKLIARSPNLLLEDHFHLGKPPLNTRQAKKLRSEYLPRPPPSIVKAKYPSPDVDCADENAVVNTRHPAINNGLRKGLVAQHSNNGSNAPPAPISNSKNIKPSSWCFPSPGNQWLVSVMSPSEGLIYKPYTGACPPPAGFVTPFYGSCVPMSLNPMGGEFLNTTNGVSASPQGIGVLPTTIPLGQTLFPPFGMPVMNPSVSGSAVEQTISFPGAQAEDISFMMPHRSSRNLSSQMSRVISNPKENFQNSKESELQGSTATSPSERQRGDALPLFPMEPTVQASDHNDQGDEQHARVIKVVPHNPRVATESAARIFQTIQEERKHLDQFELHLM